MRILLALLLLAIPVTAHGVEGDYLDHITADEIKLAPGESVERVLAFEGGDFSADWWMLIRADVTEQTRIDIFQEGKFLSRWNWPAGNHVVTQHLPETGFMQVRFTNMGDDNGTVRYYYDQTCDCTGKRIAVNPGPVWFNIDAEAGERVTFDWVIGIAGIGTDKPENLTIKVDRLRPEDTQALTRLEQVEQNFTIHADEACYPGGAWNGCFTMSFIAPYTGTQYIWFYANHDGGPEFTVSLPVQVKVEPVDDEQTTPAPAWALLVALAIFARRRQTPP